MKLKISDIKPNPDNPRLIKDDKFKKLVNSIKEFPEMAEVREIVVNKDNMILGGNMRFKAMVEAGWKEVPVRVVDWPEDKQKQFIIKDNVSGGEWDWDILANEWDSDTLSDWGLDLPAGFGEEEVVEDEAPPVADIALSKLGEIYQLGRHRLMCGDSIDQASFQKLLDGKKADLVFTDPPYGVDYGAKNRLLNSFQPSGRNLQDIKNDMLGKDELFDMLVKAFTNAHEAGADHCSYYVTAPQGGELGLMMMMMMSAGLPIRHVLIWNKNQQNFSLGRLDYEYKHEPILYTWKKTHNFYGKGNFKNSVWDIDKPRSAKEHPTMKPVELVANAILNSSQENELVLDMFMGSGTTLIASEQTNRDCVGIELDPKYADVIRKRYWKFTHDNNEEGWEDGTPIISERAAINA